MTDQVLDVLNLGVVIIDGAYRIYGWNRWMEIRSGRLREEAEGANLLNLYPRLSTPHFLRSCKAVMRFGNFVFFSQKLHNYLFPFQATGIYADYFDHMQQSCTMTPIRERGEITRIVITVQDVTENVFLEKNLKALTQQDSLTGIHNRRYLDKRLSEELLRFKRHGSFFSLILFDIDDFKMVNDTYGHQFGDRVLINLAGLCTTVIRGSDILARFGGEEFCIILADSAGQGALSFAERLRLQVEKQITRYNNSTDVAVTISMGIAEISPEIETAEQMLDRADIAMYRAKGQGKNRVVLYSAEN